MLTKPNEKFASIEKRLNVIQELAQIKILDPNQNNTSFCCGFRLDFIIHMILINSVVVGRHLQRVEELGIDQCWVVALG